MRRPAARRPCRDKAVRTRSLAVKGQNAFGERHAEDVLSRSKEVAPTLAVRQNRDACPNLRFRDRGDEQRIG